jgi:cell division protein FtsN
MAYRKLWGAALTYAGTLVALALLVFGIGRLVLKFDETTEMALLAAFAALAFVIPGVLGNALFHASCRKKMAQALASHATLPEACAMLQGQASSKSRLIWLALANAALVGAVVGASLWLPQAGMLPGPLDSKLQKPAEGRNVAVGRTTEAITAAPSTVAASAPAATASAPVPAASFAASATPVPAASSPVTAAFASAPASASVPASAPKESVAIAPKAAASAPASPAIAKPVAPVAQPTAIKAKIAKTPSVTAKITTPAAAKEELFYVNVGLFADENNARNANTKLLDAGLGSFTQEFSTPKGKRTRVRVGPLATRAEADTAADKIRALGLDAIVFQQ